MDHAGQTVAVNLGRAPFDFDLSTLQDTAVPHLGGLRVLEVMFYSRIPGSMGFFVLF